MAVLLGSSLVLRLLQFHVVEVALRRNLHIFLLHFSFVVEALLVSTLLSPSRRVWGGGCNGYEIPCLNVLVIEL